MDSNLVIRKDGGSTPDRLWEEAREIFNQGFGRSKRPKVDDTTRLEDTIKTLKLVQSKVSNEYGTLSLHKGSKEIEINVGRIMRRLELILQVGDAAMEFGPETVSLVWSAFRMVFTGFLKDSGFCASLLDSVDQISDMLFEGQIYAERYFRTRAAEEDSEAAATRVLEKIPPLYATVMKFSYQARNLVNEHGSRTMIGVFGGEFEELKVTINDAQKIRDAIQRTAGIAFQEAAIGILQGDSKFVNEAISAVIIPYLKDIQSESIKDRELQENKDLEEAYQGQLDWLLPGDSARFQGPEKQHSANLKYRHPGTCKWILKTPKYETWRDQQPSSLLHLFGEGGYGKSYLVSTIIEDLVNHISPQPSSMVYFFCKSGDNATQYVVNIMLYLVARLFTICRDEVKKGDDRLSSQNVKYRKIVNIVKSVREKMKNPAGEKDSSSLQIDSVLQPMFVDLAEAINTKLYVIVDALDECCDFAKGLLDTLKTLPGFDIRVLISSRPDDQIRSTLSEVCHLEIEVNKETNYADILAYVDESLKSMQRFQRFRAGPTIVEKSDGMFKCMFSLIASSYSLTDTSADANLVIESLKQPKALRTNPQQLMNHLPDGMNKLYRQKLQGLQEDDRKMLLSALRWLMCSEGEIDSALVADDIEKCFEDQEYSDTDAAIVIDPRVSLGIEAQEGVTNHEDRDSIKRLKEVGRDFLKFSSAAVHIQHQSVRDFVDSEERPQPRDSGMCPACSKRMDQESAYQASQKYGHLKMVRRIFKKLMSPSFQDQFIMIRGFDQSTIDTGLVFLFPKRQNIDVSLSDDIQSSSSILQSQANIDVHDDTTQAGVESGTKKAELSVQSTAEAEEADPIHGLPDYDSDNETPRYELAQWPRHLRAAEETWPEAQRDAATRERWNKLYNTVEKFLSLETPVYRCWSRRLSLWRQKPPNPLHVAASFGLLKMMERYILHGTNVDVRDENGLTPLHFTCLGSGNVSGIELLVRHGADVNALTKDNGTPLLLLTEGSGSSTMFQYLLDHGAKPDVPDYYGRTCLQGCIFRRDLRLCEILLRSGMVDVNERNSEGDTPLHWIFYFPNAPLELVTLLLGHGANVNEQNKHSEGPLYAACLVGNVPAARVLLDYKADINDDEDVFGRTALHAAVEARKVELVKLLVERGADVYRRDKRGRDCFALAAFEKQVEIIDYLLETWKSQGATTLHVLTKDLEGNTPLHLGALAGSEKAVDGLLKAGDTAAMCSERNHDGAIPLDSAFEGWKGDYESPEFGKVIIRLAPLSPDIGQNACNVDFAIEKGAVEFIRQIDKPQSSIDIHGWSPTMLAEVCGQYEVASLLLRNVPPATIKDSIPRRKGDFLRSPSRWATTAVLNLLVISEDGLEVTYPPDPQSPSLYECTSTRTDHPVPAGISRYYFEISVLESALELPVLGLGFSNRYAKMNGNMPGWPGNGAPSWGYHGDDGEKFANVGYGEKYGEGYGPGDVVGCGVDFTAGTIFYTKNGILLPTAFEGVRGRLFPTVGMAPGCGIKIRANFGHQKDVPFRYQPH